MTPEERFWQFQGDLVKPGSDTRNCFIQQVTEAIEEAIMASQSMAEFNKIKGAVAEENKACSRVALAEAETCERYNTEHFCEDFGCHSLFQVAARIRKRVKG